MSNPHRPPVPSTEFLTRADVALMLGVSPNTIARWARQGRLACQMTLGGHRRFERKMIEDVRERMRTHES